MNPICQPTASRARTAPLPAVVFETSSPLRRPTARKRPPLATGRAQRGVVSAYIIDTTDLAFTTKIRNVIQYVFECLHDVVIRNSDAQTIAPLLKKCVTEMRALGAISPQRLGAETLRHLQELSEETEAFLNDEKTRLTGQQESAAGTQYYRHYIRIAWLTHYILGDLDSL